MPKELRISKYESSGISISWVKTAQRIDVFGWYDDLVGIEGASFSLREFLDKLGITEKDCKRAYDPK